MREGSLLFFKVKCQGNSITLKEIMIRERSLSMSEIKGQGCSITLKENLVRMI
jgi:hypothetical protein